MITLRPPVKAALLYQPVQRIVAEVAVAAVLVTGEYQKNVMVM